MTKDKFYNLILKFYLFFIFVFIFTPIAFSIIFSFNSQRFPTIPLGNFSLEWYLKIFNDSEKVPWTTISKAKAELVKASNDSRFTDMKDEVEIIKKYIDDLEKDFSS